MEVWIWAYDVEGGGGGGGRWDAGDWGGGGGAGGGGVGGRITRDLRSASRLGLESCKPGLREAGGGGVVCEQRRRWEQFVQPMTMLLRFRSSSRI